MQLDVRALDFPVYQIDSVLFASLIGWLNFFPNLPGGLKQLSS